MKLRLLASLIEKLLPERKGDDLPDMYLPQRILSMALVMLLVGAILIAVYCLNAALPLLIFGILLLLFCASAFLSWRNQSLRILEGDRFVYTTFLGRRKEFAFSQITALRRNRDSITLFAGNEKIHVESGAILSDRLLARLQQIFVPAQNSQA